jgi:hypothetical protein
LEELVSGLLRPKLFPFGKLSKAKPAAQYCTVNVDCVKFEYVVLAKYHHMLIFEFDLLTKQHILILCKKLL